MKMELNRKANGIAHAIINSIDNILLTVDVATIKICLWLLYSVDVKASAVFTASALAINLSMWQKASVTRPDLSYSAGVTYLAAARPGL